MPMRTEVVARTARTETRQHATPEPIAREHSRDVSRGGLHRIVVVGGGAGGLELVTRLGDQLGRRGMADVTLIERSRTHLWKPLLHEVAAGSLDLVVAGGPDLALVAKGRHALAVGVITTGPRQTTLIVRNDNPMKEHAELKGKRIGISTAGGLSDWVVRQLSRRLGFGAQGIT